MSVRCQTVCVDCNAEAPEIGDGGVFGEPSLDVRYTEDEEWGVRSYTFGWLYDGLKRLGIMPHDLEAYAAFLKAHEGHDVRLTTDHDDDEPPVDWESLERFSWPADGFVTAYFEMEDLGEGSRLRVSTPDLLWPIEPRTLAPEVLDMVFQRLFDDSEATEGIANASPLVQPYEGLSEIEDFLEPRRKLGVAVRVIPVEGTA